MSTAYLLELAILISNVYKMVPQADESDPELSRIEVQSIDLVIRV